MRSINQDSLKVLIVAENVSARFGGESMLPLHYFRLLLKRGIDVRLTVHARVREELELLFPNDLERIYFIDDLWIQKKLYAMGMTLPRRMAEISLHWMVHLITALRQRKVVRRLVKKGDVNVVHQPIPVSPRQPSIIFGVGAPVIIGPMNGGMSYPPAFSYMEKRFERFAVSLGRTLAAIMNLVLPGKRFASLLLVANERTRLSLPSTATKHVEFLVENGVDSIAWNEVAKNPESTEPPTFIFLGRLVDWKGVDLLLEAISQVVNVRDVRLKIVGDGEEMDHLVQLASELRVDNRVQFFGFLPQAECIQHLNSARALVLPSLYECGGAVVLEAMCSGTAVIATRWGGPKDYLNECCGIMIDPDGRESMIRQIREAIVKLIDDQLLAEEMGRHGKDLVMHEYSWQKKIDQIIEFYLLALKRKIA